MQPLLYYAYKNLIRSLIISTAIKLPDVLVEAAKINGKAEFRSPPKQIEYWARIGKMSDESPDLPLGFVKGILVGLEEIKAGDVLPYEFE